MISNLPTVEDFNKLYASNGVFTNQKMFYEFSTPASRIQYPPIFTLKTRPYKGLPSAYQVYMDSIDEYDAAMKLAPNLKTWDSLKAVDWFLNGDPSRSHDGLVAWREHMQARDISLAKALLIEQVKEGNTVAAGRLITESKSKAPVGRKNKKTTSMPTSTVSRIKDFKKGS